MVERKVVEALLAAVDCDDPWWFTKTEMVVIAALCRAWLAVDSGQVETVREAKYLDGTRVGKLIATAPEHMQDSFGDKAFIPVHKYADAGNVLVGEIGSIYEFRIGKEVERLDGSGLT